MKQLHIDPAGRAIPDVAEQPETGNIGARACTEPLHAGGSRAVDNSIDAIAPSIQRPWHAPHFGRQQCAGTEWLWSAPACHLAAVPPLRSSAPNQ